MNEDFLDILAALQEHDADFLIVGAHAMAANGVPRATVDLDILVRPTTANAHRVYQALKAFGAPLATHGVEEQDFARPGTVYQLGLPPRRIDLTTSIDGVTFEEAKQSRLHRRLERLRVPFLGLRALVRSKHAAGRAKDLLDLTLLREAGVDVDRLLQP